MDELRDQLENAKTYEMSQQEKEFVDLTKEVEDLRKYKKENEKKLKQPKNLQNVDIEEKKQLDKAKTHFEQKNIEIEELLENLRKMGTDGKGILAPDALNSDQIQALLRFCVKEVIVKDILNEKEDGGDTKKAQDVLAKLLASNPNLAQSSDSGRSGTRTKSPGRSILRKPANETINQRDLDDLERIGATNQQETLLRDAVAEGNLMQPSINMELETNDIFQHSVFTIKFKAIKTPNSLPKNMMEEGLPSKLNLSFLWYNEPRRILVENLSLKQTKDVDKYVDNEEAKDEGIELGQLYYFIKEDNMAYFNKDKPTIEQILEKSEEVRFDMGPDVSGDPREHTKFAKYLEDRNLLIDITYDGVNNFGRAIVPLRKMLRQGQPSVVKAMCFDIHDENQVWMGQLLLMLENKGQKANLEGLSKNMDGTFLTSQRERELMPASAPSGDQTTLKKVFSRPLDQKAGTAKESQMKELLMTIGTEFDYRADRRATYNNMDSEAARKQVRIQRLRENQSKRHVNPDMLHDENAAEYEKRLALKQIEHVRQLKKRRALIQQTA